MKEFIIKFEGMIFVAIAKDDTIRISNLRLSQSNDQMFFHIKELLIRNIEDGLYSKEISNAIHNNLERLELK